MLRMSQTWAHAWDGMIQLRPAITAVDCRASSKRYKCLEERLSDALSANEIKSTQPVIFTGLQQCDHRSMVLSPG